MTSILSIGSKSGAPPPYSEVVDGCSSSELPSGFTTTSELQIEAIGYDTNQALTGKTLENISVYRPESGKLEYTSIRLKRSSNSCALVPGSSSTPLIATIYRWGPGRPPKMRMFPSHTSSTIEDAINADDVDCELVEVRSRSIFSRTQKMDSTLGKFEWRYGSRSDRKEAYEADSLLIMERTDVSASPTGNTGERGVRVAQLVRNGEFRTSGTSRCMGGNGGRLMMDLSSWADNKSTTVEAVEAFMVASCICMLKREADRFQNNQIAAVT